VSLGVVNSCNQIVGSNALIDDELNGTEGDDCIYANGSNSVLGKSGNDKIFAGSLQSPYVVQFAGYTELKGDAGNDILTGGDFNGLNNYLNILDGSNETLKGVGEKDTLIGGVISRNYFYLGGCAAGSYYLGNGDNDYATITNFDPSKDSIVFYPGYQYQVVFENGVSSIYAFGSDQGGGVTYPNIPVADLVARINSSTPIVVPSIDEFLSSDIIYTGPFAAFDCSIG
jgi:hypothetical protein